MLQGNSKVKLLIGVGIVLFTLFQYYSRSEMNEFTGKKQHISLSTYDEIAIKLQSAAEMAKQHGGLHPYQKSLDLVDEIGQKLVHDSVAEEMVYAYDFHLLADSQTINAFALPS